MRQRHLFQSIVATVLIGAVTMLAGCGGLSSVTAPLPLSPSTSSSDFVLSVQPVMGKHVPGSSARVTVGVKGANLREKVTVSFSGLPAGVTLTPAQFSIGSGEQRDIAVFVSSASVITEIRLTVNGIAGPIHHSVQATLPVRCVGLPESSTDTGGCPVSPLPAGRTAYTRTDVQWDTSFLNFAPQRWIIYHQPTRRFFATDTFLNRIDVLDADREKLIAEIPVPGPFVGDETPDHSAIYMGTQVGDVYKIDPVNLKVMQRFPAVQIGPEGFTAFEVRVLADGRLALLGAQGGIPAIDGYSSLAIWNPVDNSFFIAPRLGFTGCPFPDHITEFALTADRKKIILGSGVSGAAICTYDPVTDAQKAVATDPLGIGVGAILVPPDGKEIIVPAGAKVQIFDANGLFPIDQFQIGDGTNFFYYLLSFDGNTLFVFPKNNGDLLQAYDWRTHQLKGWAPGMEFLDLGTGLCPLAADETGLIATAAAHGIGFLDGGNITPGNPTSGVSNSFVSPSFGPLGGGTTTQITFIANPPAVSKVFFGSNLATNVTPSSFEGVSATSPAGSAGPVDIRVILPDGNLLVAPESFSYGPSIVEVVTDSTSAEGGATGIIFGYGFGTPRFGGKADAALQVRVNGQAAANPTYLPNPLDVTSVSGNYLFPMEALTFAFPAETAGTAADITVSTSAGSATAPHAVDYLLGVQKFPLPGSVLVHGIYDPKRDVYYFTDANKVQVFSKTQRAWLTPMNMPTGATRLWALALSPDGSKLAVGDAGTDRIYVFNPDVPNVISTFNAAHPVDPASGNPAGLAITDAGIVYYMVFFTQFTGPPGLHKLDTTTGKVTEFQSISALALGNDAYTRVVLSSDNARLYINDEGTLLELDTATDTPFFNAQVFNSGDYELTLSSNQTWMSSNEWLMDTNLNPESFLTFTDRQAVSALEVFGAKVSPDGSLFFQPLLDGIDVFDGRQGTLRTRIALPFQLSANYDALVSNGKDNILLGIVGQHGDGGIAVIDLTSLPEPLPLPFADSSSGLLRKLEVSSILKPRTPRASSTTAGQPGEPTKPYPSWPPHIVNNPTGNGEARVLP